MLQFYFYKSEKFLSTPSARRATKIYHAMGLDKEISIHALRAVGDSSPGALHPADQISIHALREEGDYLEKVGEVDTYEFLSTPSARRAT